MDKLTVTGYFRRPAFLVAQHKGFFAKEGLEVGFHLVGLCPDHNRELAEGVWPITMSSADTMLARATQDGVDFVIFMEAEQGLDVQLVAKPEIKAFADLRGKVFAADPVDSNFDLVRNKIMLDHGVAESDYDIKILGNSHHRLAGFLEGKVSAAMLAPPSTEKALAAGGHIMAEGEDYVKDWPIVCGWGLRSWAEANRPLLVRYIRAYAAATDWLLLPQNREETLALVMAEEKLSRHRAELTYKYVVPHCAIDPEAIRKNIELRIDLGYYKPPHKTAEAFYDMSYWSEATGLPIPKPAARPKNAVLA